MDDEIEKKIEETIEKKAEAVLEGEDSDSKLGQLIEKKVEEVAARKTENGESSVGSFDPINSVTRRKFLKMLGLGAGGLALASQASAGFLSLSSNDGGGTSDHGKLSGLSDDDHTQYLLADGTRSMSGDLQLETDVSIDDSNGNRLIRRLSSNDYGYLYTSGSGSSGFNIWDKNNAQDLFVANEGGPVEVQNADLRLPTGNSIEDGSGNPRLLINSSSTQIKPEGGAAAPRLDLEDGNYGRIVVGNESWKVKDAKGGFTAYQYTTAASAPGTLKMTNAQAELQSGGDGNNSYQDSGSGIISMILGPRSDGFNESYRIAFESDSDYGVMLFGDSGELTAVDDAGNRTTLT